MSEEISIPLALETEPRPLADKEKLAAWMIVNRLATGHGDTFEDLLKELTWQVKELRDREKFWRKKIDDAPEA